jgi:3-phenylpropionate/trans-cinnamate dioxygenase ferredoxin subunit
MKLILAMSCLPASDANIAARSTGGAALQDDRYVFVTTIDQVPAGQCRAFDIGGASVLVCHTGDGFHAIENVCSHAGTPLHNGRLRGNRIICPLHGASFDVRDGSATRPASRPVRTWPLRVNEGRIEIALAGT